MIILSVIDYKTCRMFKIHIEFGPPTLGTTKVYDDLGRELLINNVTLHFDENSMVYSAKIITDTEVLSTTIVGINCPQKVTETCNG